MVSRYLEVGERRGRRRGIESAGVAVAAVVVIITVVAVVTRTR